MKRFLICCCVVMLAAVSGAQAPPTPPAGTTNVEVDPIRCWWRTSAGAVRLGETFDLWMTCAVLENEAVQVTPDESRLGATVIQLSPFEVIGGSHPADLRSGSRRFFQYQYTLRLIHPDAIGKDVTIPLMTLHYRITSRVPGNAALQGRDLTYIMPVQAIRFVSVVPAEATDIRDTDGADFGRVETLAFRASVFEIVGMACIALGGLMILIVLINFARRAARRTPADERLISTRALISAGARELAAVQREREAQGWTDELVGRATAATRIVSSCALGKAPSQRVAGKALGGEGRLIVRGAMRGKARVVSSPATAGAMAAAIARRPPGDPALPAMETLRDALASFSTTQYGRGGAFDESTLDGALSGATTAAGQVKAQHGWLKTTIQQLRSGGAPVESQA